MVRLLNSLRKEPRRTRARIKTPTLLPRFSRISSPSEMRLNRSQETQGNQLRNIARIKRRKKPAGALTNEKYARSLLRPKQKNNPRSSVREQAVLVDKQFTLKLSKETAERWTTKYS